MTLPPPGQASSNLRLPEYQAKKLYNALKISFENPMNKGTKEFANAWSNAPGVGTGYKLVICEFIIVYLD